MAEPQVTPATGAEQAPQSVESRLANFLGKEPAQSQDDASDADAAPATEAQPQQGQDEAGLSPDDIPDEQAPVEQPQGGELFEFDAAGERLKLPRDEVIKLAQQGHDYTRKTMALAEQQRQVAERLARVQAVEQVHPQLQQAHAQVNALAAQLGRYQNVDWVALATNDPLEYSKVRAQYDVIAQTHQRAYGMFQQMSHAVRQQTDALNAQAMQAEGENLRERIPAWKDPEQYKKGASELTSWLVSEGADPGEVASLNSSVAVAIAWKAMQYDKLAKAKAGKVKLLQTAPPVTRPGADQSRGSAQADKEVALTQRLKKSGSVNDAAALLMARFK